MAMDEVFVGRNKIKVLTKKEQDGMRKVCRLAREVLDIAARAAKPGVTTDEIDKIVHDACVERKVSTPFATLDCSRVLGKRYLLTARSRTLRHLTTATFLNQFAHHPTKSFATEYQISDRSRTATSSTSM